MHRLTYRQAMTKLAIKEREDKRAPAVGPTRAAADKLKKDPGITPQEALGVKRSTAPVAQPRAQIQDLLKYYVSKDGTRLTPFDWKSASPEFKEAWMSKYNELYGTGHQYNIIKPVDKEYLSSRDQRNAPYHPGSESYYANIGATDTYKDGMTVSDFDSLLREQRVNAARLHGEVSNFAERGYLNPFGWFGQKYSPIWHNTQRAIDSLSSDDPLQTMLNNEARSWYGKQTGHEIKENEKHINDSERRALATSHVLARVGDGMYLNVLPVGSISASLGMRAAGYKRPDGKNIGITKGDEAAASAYGAAVARDFGDEQAAKSEARLRLAGSLGNLVGTAVPIVLTSGAGAPVSLPSALSTARVAAPIAAGLETAGDAWGAIKGDPNTKPAAYARVAASGANMVGRMGMFHFNPGTIGTAGYAAKSGLFTLGLGEADSLLNGEGLSWDPVRQAVLTAGFSFVPGVRVAPQLAAGLTTQVGDMATTNARRDYPVIDALVGKQQNFQDYEANKKAILTDPTRRQEFLSGVQASYPDLDVNSLSDADVASLYENVNRGIAATAIAGGAIQLLASQSGKNFKSEEEVKEYIKSLPDEERQTALFNTANAYVASGAALPPALYNATAGYMSPEQVDKLFESRAKHIIFATQGKGAVIGSALKKLVPGVDGDAIDVKLFKQAMDSSPEFKVEAGQYIASKIRLAAIDPDNSGQVSGNAVKFLGALTRPELDECFTAALSGTTAAQDASLLSGGGKGTNLPDGVAEAAASVIRAKALDTENNPGYGVGLLVQMADKMKEGAQVPPEQQQLITGMIKSMTSEERRDIFASANAEDWEGFTKFVLKQQDGAVPNGFTEDEWAGIKADVEAGVKDCAKRLWKENPIKNTPLLVSAWLRGKGWEGMSDFFRNPLMFYGTLALLLGGVLFLGKSVFGSRQPQDNTNKYLGDIAAALRQ